MTYLCICCTFAAVTQSLLAISEVYQILSSKKRDKEGWAEEVGVRFGVGDRGCMRSKRLFFSAFLFFCESLKIERYRVFLLFPNDKSLFSVRCWIFSFLSVSSSLHIFSLSSSFSSSSLFFIPLLCSILHTLTDFKQLLSRCYYHSARKLLQQAPPFVSTYLQSKSSFPNHSSLWELNSVLLALFAWMVINRYCQSMTLNTLWAEYSKYSISSFCWILSHSVSCICRGFPSSSHTALCSADFIIQQGQGVPMSVSQARLYSLALLICIFFGVELFKLAELFLPLLFMFSNHWTLSIHQQRVSLSEFPLCEQGDSIFYVLLCKYREVISNINRKVKRQADKNWRQKGW